MLYDPSFMGVENIAYPLILNELENNYKSFLDWGFLNIGAFTNVNIPTQNINALDLHKLKPTEDPQRKSRTVWQSPRKDWIYESGLAYSGMSPINISGVFVNSTFYPAPTGNPTLGYKINYPEGKVIFDKPIATNSNVELSYSYRNIQVYKLEEFPYWREIQHRSLENKTGLTLSDKGDFSISSEHRVQLPAIVIESVSRSDSKPLHLGDTSQILEQDILLHILCDSNSIRNNIVDILRLQKDKIIYLYKTKTVVDDNVYPLNFDGSKNLNGQNYLYITNNSHYRWIECRIKDVNISDIYFDNIRMYGSIVRMTNELIIVQNDPNTFC